MADYTPVRAYLGMPNIGRPKATQAAAWDVMKAWIDEAAENGHKSAKADVKELMNNADVAVSRLCDVIMQQADEIKDLKVQLAAGGGADELKELKQKIAELVE